MFVKPNQTLTTLPDLAATYRHRARQAPSGPCDPCGWTVVLSHVTLFAFTVIATPQIPEDTNADCHF